MDKSKIIKSVIIGIVSISGIIGALLFFNTLSCVSVPKIIPGEPMVCTKASQWAYLAIMGKDKVPESVSTEGIRSCAAQLRYQFCINERDSYLNTNKSTNNEGNYLIQMTANNILNNCLLNLKP